MASNRQVNISLCRIAEETDCDEPAEYCFQYAGRRWTLIAPLQAVYDQWMRVLDAHFGNDSATRKIALHEAFQEGRAYLDAVYTGGTAFTYGSKKDASNVVAELFPILYDNYTAVLNIRTPLQEDGGTDEQTLMSTYVTTKLYDILYLKHLSALGSGSEEPPALALPTCFKPTLCGYQKRSVHWLLQREQQSETFPAYYMRLQAKAGGNVIYKHTFCEHITKEPPAHIQLPPGGILADEMGLGKTVEMLALILLHRRIHTAASPSAALNVQLDKDAIPEKRTRSEPKVFCICNSTRSDGIVECRRCLLWQHRKCVHKFNHDHPDDVNEPYLCPSCCNETTCEAGSLLETSATFIVSPNTIRTQWLAEIRRHIEPGLRVLVYDGIVSGWISPRQMANYDVVLTDYQVLRSEVYHTNDNVSDRVTRNKPRSMRMLTPLLMLHWWRVCLDEAQMVESKVSKVAMLVRLLPAVNRWAVTGTPIQRSIDDLHSLLSFIGFHEVCEPLVVWNNLVHDFVLNYERPAQRLPLIDVLQKCMWRTCKSKIVDELKIPPQSETVHRIELSSLEKLFYMEQHTDCRTKFYGNADKYIERSDQQLRTISPHIMKLILQPLLKIRQCCTASVISGGSHNNAAFAQKKFLTPKELHAHLKATNENECKSELRSMASSHNGMAAIHFILKNYDEAIQNYRSVLKLSKDYLDMNITVDSLLQIHALYNILQASYHLQHAHQYDELPGDTLQKYEERYNALEGKYLEPYIAVLANVRSAAEQAHASLDAVQASSSNTVEFAATLLEAVVNCARGVQLQKQLMNKFMDECLGLFADNAKLNEMHSVNSILYILSTWFDKVTQLQASIIGKFKDIQFFMDNVRPRSDVNLDVWRQMRQFITSVYDCHLRELRDTTSQPGPGGVNDTPKNKVTCRLCKIQHELNNFECLLFAKVIDKETNQTEGMSHPSFEIVLLKVFFSFVKAKGQFHTFHQDIDNQLEIVEGLQAMCKKYIKYWIEIEYTVKAYDELDMCKMRITIADDEEETSFYKISKHDINASYNEHKFSLYCAQRKFVTKYRRLRYITHLEADTEPGTCPICQTKIEKRYTVLECGHHVCWSCLKRLQNYSNAKDSISCAICRNEQSADKIYYVCMVSKHQVDRFDDIPTVGNYSSKITYIVCLIIKLKRAHTDNEHPLQILIFSQWLEILCTIADALKQEGIKFCVQKCNRAIIKFKQPEENITCLLMPLKKGSKGLNLIEATHVFLVEPILNPGEELQAIGRVHRFGQTKPTTVHRFIVNNTIEENVYKLVAAGKQNQANWEFKNISLEDLKNLFQLDNDITNETDGADSEMLE